MRNRECARVGVATQGELSVTEFRIGSSLPYGRMERYEKIRVIGQGAFG